jgi:small subunit ribosomal protein S9
MADEDEREGQAEQPDPGEATQAGEGAAVQDASEEAAAAQDERASAEQEQGEVPAHAVPGGDAQEIAGSAEDAALEAFEESREHPGEPAPEPPVAEPAGEGHAVPTAEAMEVAGASEDAPLEALQEAEDKQALDAAVEEDEEEEEPTPREKPAVPGAHLEVDIVPEGEDPLGRGEATYEDPYAVEEEEPAQAPRAEEEPEEPLAGPIASATIDLAGDARYRATGKRKTAIARVLLRPGTGSYTINGRPLEEHFPRLTLQRNIRQPLETVGYQERMDVVARLHGGGISAQAGALRHGVSRALLEADPNLRGELKRRGFLTRDSRAKERKKAGLKKARKRPQFSKR